MQTLMKTFLAMTLLVFGLGFIHAAKATAYHCLDPAFIKKQKNPDTKRIEWSFGTPFSGGWFGLQTEPVSTLGTPLPAGNIRAIQLDYGPDGTSWPVPVITCFYLGDGNKTASGYMSVRFFDRPQSTPSIDDVHYSKIVYCDPSDPDKCEIIVD